MHSNPPQLPASTESIHAHGITLLLEWIPVLSTWEQGIRAREHPNRTIERCEYAELRTGRWTFSTASTQAQPSVVLWDEPFRKLDTVHRSLKVSSTGLEINTLEHKPQRLNKLASVTSNV